MVVMTRYEQAADRAVGWLATRLCDDATGLLEFIRGRFMRPDHDFATSTRHKSDNAAFTEYWAYPNGWLAMAAQRMGRFDIAYPAFEYLRSCHEPDRGGFLTNEATADDRYLRAARGYLDFGLSCEGNLRSCHTSHKVAWGAAVLARITEEAATEVIASEQVRGVDEPWRAGEFVGKIVALQQERQQSVPPDVCGYPCSGYDLLQYRQ